MSNFSVFEVSEDEYMDHSESYDGICLSCGEWSFGGCEPDARNYKCEDCGATQVMGAELAMIAGYIEIF